MKTKIVLPVLLVAAVLVTGLTGCKNDLASGGVYSAAPFIYTSDNAAVAAYNTVDAFEKFELSVQGTSSDTAGLKTLANSVRQQFPALFNAYWTAKSTYLSAPTAANQTAMQTALTSLSSVLTGITAYYASIGTTSTTAK